MDVLEVIYIIIFCQLPLLYFPACDFLVQSSSLTIIASCIFIFIFHGKRELTEDPRIAYIHHLAVMAQKKEVATGERMDFHPLILLDFCCVCGCRSRFMD